MYILTWNVAGFQVAITKKYKNILLKRFEKAKIAVDLMKQEKTAQKSTDSYVHKSK